MPPGQRVWEIVASIAKAEISLKDLDAFLRKEFLLDQEVDDLGAEEFFQRLER
jgi:hypothetical protein